MMVMMMAVMMMIAGALQRGDQKGGGGEGSQNPRTWAQFEQPGLPADDCDGVRVMIMRGNKQINRSCVLPLTDDIWRLWKEPTTHRAGKGTARRCSPRWRNDLLRWHNQAVDHTNIPLRHNQAVDNSNIASPRLSGDEKERTTRIWGERGTAAGREEYDYQVTVQKYILKVKGTNRKFEVKVKVTMNNVKEAQQRAARNMTRYS